MIIPGWLKRIAAWVAGALAVAGAAFLAGRRDGRQSMKAKAEQKRADDLAAANEVRDEVADKDRDAVDDDLDRWMRD